MKLKFYLKGFGIGVIFATLVLSISFYSKMEDAEISRQEIEQMAAAYGMSYPEETAQEESLPQSEEITAAAQETSSETKKESDSETKESIEAEIEKETEKNQELKETQSLEIQSSETQSSETQSLEETQESEETQKSEEQQITSVPEINKETIQEPMTNRETRTSQGDSIRESIGEIEIPTITEQSRFQDLGGKWKVRTVGEGTSTKQITITVTFGMYASMIAELLEETGVIEDAQEFNAYLVGKGYTKRLLAGVYTFAEGMDFDEIAGKLIWESEE